MPTVAEVLQGLTLPVEPCTGGPIFDVQINCINGAWVGVLVDAEEVVPPGLRVAPCKCADRAAEAKAGLIEKLADKWTPLEVIELARALFPK